MLGRCDRGSGEYAGKSEEKVGEFPVCCRCGLLGGSGKAPKERWIASSALSGIGSCWARRMRRMNSRASMTASTAKAAGFGSARTKGPGELGKGSCETAGFHPITILFGVSNRHIIMDKASLYRYKLHILSKYDWQCQEKSSETVNHPSVLRFRSSLSLLRYVSADANVVFLKDSMASVSICTSCCSICFSVSAACVVNCRRVASSSARACNSAAFVA